MNSVFKHLSLWFFVWAVSVGFVNVTEAQERPNIILLMGDDHGWDETGYNGHPCLRTPVLDEMASSGLRLDRFYSASPVCSPTRGSVLTGRHPNRYGTFTPNFSIRPDEVTIAQLLSSSGYACGHFGKWHVGPVKADSPTSPGALGFETWLSHDNFFEMNPTFSRDGGPPIPFEGESSAILIDEALKFIRQSSERQQSFFVVIWFGSPHEPYSGLDEDLALYNDIPEDYQDTLVRLTSMETGRQVQRPLREVLRERYAEITAMDRAIGSLRDQLNEWALRDNTILWYCGDNGVPGNVAMATPFRGAKGDVYEGGIRVPGIIEWPSKINRPVVSEVPSVTSDILPSLCEWTDTEATQRPLDGVSLDPLLMQSALEREFPICFWNYPGGRDAQFEPYLAAELQEGTTPLVKMMDGRFTRNFRNFHHPEIRDGDTSGARAILDGDYKLVIQDRSSGTTVELFDLSTDPNEEYDLSDEQPEVTTRLTQRLSEWQQSVLESLTGADYQY